MTNDGILTWVPKNFIQGKKVEASNRVRNRKWYFYQPIKT